MRHFFTDSAIIRLPCFTMFSNPMQPKMDMKDTKFLAIGCMSALQAVFYPILQNRRSMALLKFGIQMLPTVWMLVSLSASCRGCVEGMKSIGIFCEVAGTF